jgi:hypothetical protein
MFNRRDEAASWPSRNKLSTLLSLSIMMYPLTDYNVEHGEKNLENWTVPGSRFGDNDPGMIIVIQTLPRP